MKEILIKEILQISAIFAIGVERKDLEKLTKEKLRENFKFINEYRKWRQYEKTNLFRYGRRPMQF